jgi:hypothetical protein
MLRKVHVFFLHAAEPAGRRGFPFPDQPLDVLYHRNVFFAQLFPPEEVHHVLVQRGGLVAAETVFFGEVEHKIREAAGIVVEHGNVAGSLVGHVHVVALVHEAQQRAAHRDHVVVGVGAEDDRTFAGRQGSFGAVGVVGVGLAAGPAGNGVLDGVEYLDVELVGVAGVHQQVHQARLLVVFVGEFEDRLADGGAQPDHGAAGELLVVPVAKALPARAC